MEPIIQLAIEKGLITAEAADALETELAQRGCVTTAGVTRIDDGATVGQSSYPEIESHPSLSGSARTLSKVGRYEVIKLLGEGGMGSVYQAYDPLLKRNIALKFIREQDPQLVELLLREGRAQAKIEHPNVCKVYEIGQYKDQFFIAMQYLSGVSLTEAAKEMTPEQKVKVIAQVAEALHAAHKEGLIHRDIKPQNIMVEKSEDGGWFPYVMDFGLAREITAPGITVLGKVLGTPSYMAPEQAVRAFGEDSILDRRTDIFSLGVTLYQLLVGQLPFGQGTSMEILTRVVQMEAVPMRKLAPAIPVDLETIVMKCLEKEPQQRYDSARALGRDLLRYLEGEPIQAHRTSVFYRAVKKIRKNRTLAAVVAVSALLVAVWTVVGISARWQAKEQTVLAQRFGQQVKDIEWMMRIANMAALHDIRQERALMHTRMRKIEEQIKQLGSISAGPGHYALGRGYLALRDYDQAQQHLNLAIASGYRTVEVEYALGLTLGALYKQGLDEVERIGNPDLRAARKREVEASYREPALQHLKNSQSLEVESPAYVEGLIAFYDKRYAEALQKARQAFRQVPWLYEAKQLEGDSYVMQGKDKIETGDYQGALSDFTEAGQAYQLAAAIGRSDATVYEVECGRYVQLMELAEAKGDAPNQALKGLIAACDTALQADPESKAAYIHKSTGYLNLGVYQIGHGEDPHDTVRKAAAMAEHVSRNHPMNADSYYNIGYANYLLGRYESETGIDPRPSFNNAVANYHQALRINPNMTVVYNALGAALILQGEYEIGNNLDPRPSFDQAIESYQKALRINASFAFIHINLCYLYHRLASYEIDKGLDPRLSLQRGIESFEKAVQINPNDQAAYNNVGNIYATQADYQLKTGNDPQASLDKAIEHYNKGLALDPNSAPLYIDIGNIYGLKADYLCNHGNNPLADYERAIESYQKALAINKNYADAYFNIGFYALHKAQHELARGLDPTLSLSLALDNCDKSLKVNPNQTSAYTMKAACYKTSGEYALKQGKETASAFNEARNNLQKALSIDAKASEIPFRAGEIELAAARAAMRQHRSPQPYFVKAEAALNRVLQLNPESVDARRVMAQLYLERAQWQWQAKTPLEAEIEKGLAMVEKVLAKNPRLAEALALRGAFSAMAARTEKSAAARQELAKRAQTALTEAFKINSFLQSSYQSFYIEAQKTD